MKKGFLVCLLLVGVLLSQAVLANATHQGNSDVVGKLAVVPDQVPRFSLNIASDRGEWGYYRNGDRISFRALSSATARVAVIGINVYGQLSLLLPNDYDLDNQLVANRTVSLPRTGYHYEVDTPVAGTEHVLVVGCQRRSDLVDNLVSRIRSGSISSINSLGSALRTMAAQAGGDWSIDLTSYYCNVNLPQQTGLLVLSMGVSNYQSSQVNDLPSPADDARDFASLMQKKYNVPSSNVRLLVDSQASKAGIVAGLNWLVSQANSSKDVLVFFSGHGGQLKDENGDEDDGMDEVLCPYDFSMQDKVHTALLDDEIAVFIQTLTSKAHSVTFIFDSCFSGSAQKALPTGVSDGDAERKGFGLGTMESGSKAMDINVSSNFAFLAASKGNETARDFHSHFGHSLYTYFLLKGLDGAADSNKDGQIGTSEIHNYIYKEIGVVSQSAGQYFQTPILDPTVNLVIWK